MHVDRRLQIRIRIELFLIKYRHQKRLKLRVTTQRLQTRISRYLICCNVAFRTCNLTIDDMICHLRLVRWCQIDIVSGGGENAYSDSELGSSISSRLARSRKKLGSVTTPSQSSPALSLTIWLGSSEIKIQCIFTQSLGV